MNPHDTYDISHVILFAHIAIIGVLMKNMVMKICDNNINMFNNVVFFYYLLLTFMNYDEFATSILHVGIMINGIYLLTK